MSVAGVRLAIDLGGTKVDAAFVDASGTVLAGTRARRPTGRDLTVDGLRSALTDVIAETTAALPTGAVVDGIGVGSAGPVEASTGTVHPVNMPGIRGVSVADAVAVAAREAGIDAPVILGHDGGCLALAEAQIGAARGAKASLSIVVSTGIGGGIVFDGVLLGGASGNAGHLGQTYLGDTTVEEIAAGPGTVAWARSQGWHGTTGVDLGRDARTGEPIARAAVERSAQAVGWALADATTLLDLEIVAIGGGFSRVTDDYVDLVSAALQSRVVVDFARATKVVRSALADDGPLIGAAALVRGR